MSRRPNNKQQRRVQFEEPNPAPQKKMKKDPEPPPKQPRKNRIVNPEDEADVHKRAEETRKRKRRLKQEEEAGVKIDSDSETNSDYDGEEKPAKDDINDELEHGTVLEAFNLREEIRDRVINLDSGVVDTKGKKEEEDEAWLQDFDENMKDDYYASKMSDLQGKMDTTEEPEYLEEATAVQLLDEISDVLRWGETVTKALNRLRPPKQPKKSKDDNTKNEVTEFDALTNKADQLLRVHGIHDIFGLTKEDILDTIDRLNGEAVDMFA